MQEKMTGSPSSQEIPNDVLEYLLEQIMARGGEKLYQGFEERLSRKEEEKMRAMQEEQMQKEQAIREAWMREHYGNLQQAFDADPEYLDLIKQRKMNKNNFGLIVDSLIDYKDKAPAMLKHLLRNENLLNDLEKAPDARDARYLLNNVFSDVSRENANQQQAQPHNPEKPIKLPDPQMMPPLTSAMENDEDKAVADSISRM